MIYHGDSLEVLKTLPDNSLDACVTDPPYGLKFMGKTWDYDVPKVELWREVLRVLKPGAHLLSFGGTRTYHRMVVAIEDAGFEIRDQIMWIYGSGFPKSHNVSKAIDKTANAKREVIGLGRQYADEGGAKDRRWEGGTTNQNIKITAPATDLAKQWDGWGTALKPANEPIVLARKPLEKGLTISENVIKWGCGALNVDESRIGNETRSYSINGAIKGGNFGNKANQPAHERETITAQGRWPANVLFDEAAAAVLDEQSGLLQSRPNRNPRPKGKFAFVEQKADELHRQQYETTKGGASRFFYVAKASKRERNQGLEEMPERICGALDGNVDHEHGNRKIGAQPSKPTAKAQNHHPTVKPIKLMEYLIKLVTPPNGKVLDPFLGSGSTLVAAKNLGFDGVGIELNAEYVEIAKKRINP